MRIESLQNARIKGVVHLRRGQAARRQGLFLIDGLREIERALSGGIQLQEAFFDPGALDTPSAAILLDRLRQSQISLAEVTSTVFAKIAYGERAEGIVAVASRRSHDLADLPQTLSRVAVLEGIEKPGNLGAIFRSADGAGVEAVLLGDGCGDIYNANAIRSSLGTVFTCATAYASTSEIMAFLRSRGIRMLAARVDGSVPYTEADFHAPVAVVMGSEADGLTEQWRGDDIQAVHLPMQGTADSLNVSVTAAIFFYEMLRGTG